MNVGVVSVGAIARVLDRDERDALFAPIGEQRRSLEALGLSEEAIEYHVRDAETRLSVDIRWFAVLTDGRLVLSAP
jgi:hypothetical protein